MKILDRTSIKNGMPAFDPKVMPQVAARRL
jgi:hypothetical protein